MHIQIHIQFLRQNLKFQIPNSKIRIQVLIFTLWHWELENQNLKFEVQNGGKIRIQSSIFPKCVNEKIKSWNLKSKYQESQITIKNNEKLKIENVQISKTKMGISYWMKSFAMNNWNASGLSTQRQTKFENLSFHCMTSIAAIARIHYRYASCLTFTAIAHYGLIDRAYFVHSGPRSNMSESHFVKAFAPHL